MDRLKLSPTRSNPTPRDLTPTSTAALEAGALRADRARLLELVFAIETGLIDGTAPTAWRELVKAAHWMRAMDLADALERRMLRD